MGLSPGNKNIRSIHKYKAVKKNLIAYMDIHDRSYKQDKFGVTWNLMRSKCVLFVVDFPSKETYKNFTAYSICIAWVLTNHVKIGIKLHGEASGMPDKYREEIISEWCPKFHQVLIENKVQRITVIIMT